MIRRRGSCCEVRNGLLARGRLITYDVLGAQSESESAMFDVGLDCGDALSLGGRCDLRRDGCVGATDSGTADGDSSSVPFDVLGESDGR